MAFLAYSKASVRNDNKMVLPWFIMGTQGDSEIILGNNKHIDFKTAFCPSHFSILALCEVLLAASLKTPEQRALSED